MIRRQALEALGGFEELFLFRLKSDLAIRMKPAGGDCDPLSARSFERRQAYLASAHRVYRSRYLFFHKHYGRKTARLKERPYKPTLNVLALGLFSTNSASRKVATKSRQARALEMAFGVSGSGCHETGRSGMRQSPKPFGWEECGVVRRCRPWIAKGPYITFRSQQDPVYIPRSTMASVLAIQYVGCRGILGLPVLKLCPINSTLTWFTSPWQTPILYRQDKPR
jgi:hypothetical protein